MGLTGSNSGLFIALGFIVSPVERRIKKKKGWKEKEYERREGRRNKNAKKGRKKE